MMKFVIVKFIIFLPCILLADFSGNFKNQNFFSNAENGNLFNLNIRARWLKHWSDQLQTELAYSLSSLYMPKEGKLQDIEFKYRIDDVAINVYRDDNNLILQNLDRFLVSYELEKWKLIVGRQIISYGKAKFINPSDIFVPFSQTAIDTEDRQGIDAFRFKYFINSLSELDFVYAMGEDAKKENSSLVIDYSTSLAEVELELSYAFVKNNLNLYALNLQTNLFEQAIWLELVNFNLNTASEYMLSVGMDYLINSETYFAIEFHYNGAGTEEISEYSNVFDSDFYKYLPIQNKSTKYFSASYSSQITGIHAITIAHSMNLIDHSNYNTIQWNWNSSENSYLDSGIIWGLGDNNSEYKELEASVYLAFRYYY